MSKVQHVSESRFQTEVAESSLPVVVDFYATWCPPCKMLAPVLDRLADQFEGRVKIVKVNVDDEPGLAATHAISGVPTMKLYSDGNVRDTIVGLLPPQALVSKIESLASQAPQAAAG